MSPDYHRFGICCSDIIITSTTHFARLPIMKVCLKGEMSLRKDKNGVMSATLLVAETVPSNSSITWHRIVLPISMLGLEDLSPYGDHSYSE